MRYLAGEGRTILVSSHLLSEMAETIDNAIIVSFGQLKLRHAGRDHRRYLERGDAGAHPEPTDSPGSRPGRHPLPPAGSRRVAIDGATPEGRATLAANQIVLYELMKEGADLESIFLPSRRTRIRRRDGGVSVIHTLRAELLKMRSMPGVWVSLRPGLPPDHPPRTGRPGLGRRLPGPHLLLRHLAGASGASSSAPATSGLCAGADHRRALHHQRIPPQDHHHVARPRPRAQPGPAGQGHRHRGHLVPSSSRCLGARRRLPSSALPWNAALGGVTSQVTDQLGAVVPGLRGLGRACSASSASASGRWSRTRWRPSSSPSAGTLILEGILDRAGHGPSSTTT